MLLSTGEQWCSDTNEVADSVEIEPDSVIKLLRYGCVRLVMEEAQIRLYHSIENSREYHEFDPQYIELRPEIAPCVDFLITK